jgi:hypothetical protein
MLIKNQRRYMILFQKLMLINLMPQDNIQESELHSMLKNKEFNGLKETAN